MLSRLWFALSVVWCVLMLAISLNPNANEGGREGLYAFAVAPLLVGLFLKKLAGYVVKGRL